jgi:hypothetical protein
MLCLCRGLVLALAASIVTGQAARGQDQPGVTIDGLDHALVLWLGSEDETDGLHALAGLARDGDTRAQVLLALVDKSPALQGPALAHMSRADRLALLRAPGGMSGTSWMRRAADGGDALALAWVTLWDTGTPPEIVTRLAALGETRASREAALVLASRDARGLVTLDPLPTGTEFLRLMGSPADMQDHLPHLDAQLHPGDPQRDTLGLASTPEARDDWLAHSDLAAPLRALCDAQCDAAGTADCLRGGLAALGDPLAVLTLGSPVESLIPADRFNLSARGQSAVLRRMMLSVDMRARPAWIARTTEISACLGAVLEAEARRYRYQRPGADVPEQTGSDN